MELQNSGTERGRTEEVRGLASKAFLPGLVLPFLAGQENKRGMAVTLLTGYLRQQAQPASVEPAPISTICHAPLSPPLSPIMCFLLGGVLVPRLGCWEQMCEQGNRASLT